MIIGLDFDDTYTKDPDLWSQFIVSALAKGHRVLCVTARRDTPENREIVKLPHEVPVFFTGLVAKRWYMETKWNIRVDVWIDDNPEAICNGV